MSMKQKVTNINNWWKTHAQYNVLRVFYQTGWNVTVLVVRRVKILMSFTELLQG
jgi:hypothetical protein